MSKPLDQRIDVTQPYDWQTELIAIIDDESAVTARTSAKLFRILTEAQKLLPPEHRKEIKLPEAL
jgi:hypothetical protein